MKEKELFTYALLSLITSIIVLFAITWWGFFYFKVFEDIPQDQRSIAVLSIGFIIYFISYFIVLFFNTAIIASVSRILNWQPNTFGDGIKDSMNNLWKIFQWAFVSATVSTILNFLEQNKTLWKIVSAILWTAWAILSFFSFPMMILKGYWPIEAIKESWKLFKKTWWERAIIYISTGLFFFMIFLLIVIMCVFIMIKGNLRLWGGLLVIFSLILMITNSLSNLIINTVLLYYADNWKLPEIVPNKEVFNYIIK